MMDDTAARAVFRERNLAVYRKEHDRAEVLLKRLRGAAPDWLKGIELSLKAMRGDRRHHVALFCPDADTARTMRDMLRDGMGPGSIGDIWDTPLNAFVSWHKGHFCTVHVFHPGTVEKPNLGLIEFAWCHGLAPDDPVVLELVRCDVETVVTGLPG